MIECSESSQLKGQTVVITGGNRGGGAAIAMRYAAAGANIVIIANKESSANSQQNVNEVSERISSVGGKAITLTVNLADSQEIKTAVNCIITHFGRIDILINNFSTFNFKNTLETTAEEFNKVMENVFATFFFSQACIPFLRESGNPHVINIAPPLDMDSAQEACEHHLLFSISKYGMSFCTMGMAAEFKKFGIAFNSLWQERPIATQTLSTNFDNQVTKGSNRPEIYAEASYLISLKPALEFTGNYCIDENILSESGVDVTQYAVDPNATPIKDIFLPGANYDILKVS
ncbi:TPA: SDR family NAD(P)-dependent oxidoreductase [Legionella pneumophila]|nr:SDR family NAD(P)-dependent oxidoreductase [Legionella pneumophila]